MKIGSIKEIIQNHPEVYFYLFIFFLALIWGTLKFTSRSSFCGSCHEIKPSVESWEKDSHQNVDCVKCHTSSGTVEFVKHKVEALREVYAHFTGNYEKPINKDGHVAKEMPNSVCVPNCHPPQIKEAVAGTIIDHPAHTEKAKKNCTYCHSGVGHARSKRGLEFMRLCLSCHTGKTLKNECEICHAKDFKLTPASHDPLDWGKSHGKLVKKEGKKECYDCHYEGKDCLDCHGMEMPHPKNWKKKHGQRKSLLPKCSQCHTNAFCEDCHHEGYNPEVETWETAHSRIVRTHGRTKCLNCHDLIFCEECHLRVGVGLP